MITTPATRQFALQAAAAILVLSLAWPYHLVTQLPVDWDLLALLIGLAAFCLATWGGLPWWWRLMHMVFAPGAALVARWQIDPGWFLLGFMLLLLIYRGALSSQVPLYFSGDDAREALLELAREREVKTVVDLGAGIGSVVAPLAHLAPDIRWLAIENSALPWLVGRLRTAGLHNCEWRWGDFWSLDLGEAQLVYAFLSPAPMAELWQKLAKEMPEGSALVSNSFAVPDVEPSVIIERGSVRLFVYEVRHEQAAKITESTDSTKPSHVA